MFPALNLVLGAFAILSLLLLLWQWFAARRFPLHQQTAAPARSPTISLLKPLKGAGDSLEDCLRSWLRQDYPGAVQILLGVDSPDDPGIAVVERIRRDFPERDLALVICRDLRGPNFKVSKLMQLQAQATGEVLVVSDADVHAPPTLLNGLVASLEGERVGMACCFYRLANPVNLATQWEAVVINADSWSQVLQSTTLMAADFALGAVMAIPRRHLATMDGFASLENYLADDYQLGNRLARRGLEIRFCPLVVECRSEPMTWSRAWQHQLRWARTIRVCQPVPYFLSILSNATLWPLAWAISTAAPGTMAFLAAAVVSRAVVAMDLERRLTGILPSWNRLWLAPLKDLLQFGLWLGAFLGNRIEWRGATMRLRRDGTLEKMENRSPAPDIS